MSNMILYAWRPAFVITLFCCSLSVGTSRSQNDLEFETFKVPRINNPQNATAFALVYGAPLLDVASFLSTPLSEVGPNVPLNQKTLASASGAAVVRPNVDTLYSQIAIDLSHHDVAITVPSIKDRFYVLPFYDIFSNNIANLGSANNTEPGQYLLRRAADVGVRPGLQLRGADCPDYAGCISFPGTYGFSLIRILLLTSRLNGERTELDIVHGYQSKILLSNITRTASSSRLGRNPPPLMSVLRNGSLTGTMPHQLLELTSKIVPYNPPRRETTANLTHNLELAGLINGCYNQVPAVNITAAEETIERVFEGHINMTLNPSIALEFGNGWFQFKPVISGNFHSDFAVRAYIAATSLGELRSYEALYPEYGSSGILEIGAKSSIVFTLSRKPPVSGFWSFTAYGPNSYLIPNPLDRYALGDRSNLSYPDGALVYGENTHDDGPFDILVQPADVTPPFNWTSNWLPGPRGGGNFSINFRLYGPEANDINGRYVFPTVKRGAAFV